MLLSVKTRLLVSCSPLSLTPCTLLLLWFCAPYAYVQAQVVAVCAAALSLVLVLGVVLSSVGEGPKHTVLKQEGFEVASTTHSALEAEIASLRARLDTAKHSLLALPKAQGEAAANPHHVLL